MPSPEFKVQQGRSTQKEYDNDFDRHQDAIRKESGERSKLAGEVATLKKQIADLQTSLARTTAPTRSSVSSSSSGSGGPLAALSIGTALQLLRTNAGATAPEWFTLYSPTWTKYTVTEADLNALSGSSDFVALLTLGAKTLIHSVVIKHSAAFTGGTVSACTVSVGISGTPLKYAPAFNIFQAPGNTVFQTSSVVGMENYGAGTVIRASFVTTGDTLANLTAGSVDIWVLAGTLP